MRLHTDTITLTDVYKAVADLPGVYVFVSEHGSRSKARAFEIKLEGTSNNRTNPGTRGAYDPESYAATWDEWGVVIARLFMIDADAFWGVPKNPTYENAWNFHTITAGRFESGDMPEDTHKRHTWQWNFGAATCKKCSAEFYPRA